MGNFYFLNQAVDVSDYGIFKNGMLELNVIEHEKDDYFLKHPTIWNIDIVRHLFECGQEEQVILLLLEQTMDVENEITGQAGFDATYTDTLNAFLGIDFTPTDIAENNRITDAESFKNSKRTYFSQLNCVGDKQKMSTCLLQLYKGYQFSPQALEDLTYWNKLQSPLYDRIHELLPDVKVNPFQGGLGKTEVLKKQEGTASKRINDEHRLTYSLKNNAITVLSCKGHYE